LAATTTNLCACADVPVSPLAPAPTPEAMARVPESTPSAGGAPPLLSASARPRHVLLRAVAQEELLELLRIPGGWAVFEAPGGATAAPVPAQEEDTGWPHELPSLYITVVAVSQEELLQMLVGARSMIL